MSTWLRVLLILVCCAGISGFAVSCGGSDGDEDDDDEISRRDERRTEEAEDEKRTAEAEEDEEDEDDEDTEPTRRPRATPTRVAASAEGAPDSFRYAVRYVFDSTTDVPDIDSDLAIEGAYVAPDSHQFSVSGKAGGTEVEGDVIIIDEEAWLRIPGGGWTPASEDDLGGLAAATTANPAFLEQYPAFLEGVGALDGEADTIDGRDAVRYEVPAGSAGAFMRIFGTSSDNLLLGDVEELTIWLDEETGHLAQASFRGSGENVDVPDDAVTITIDVSITDIGVGSIEIESPI